MHRKITTINQVTIMGLGLFGGGVGAAEYWARQGAEVTVTDLRDDQTLAPSIQALKEYSNINYVFKEHRESDFTTTDLLVVNPAVKPDNKFLQLARLAQVPITTEIGTFIQKHQKELHNPILAVTGSNGKSTTTSLLTSIIHRILPEALSGGNLGGSLLSKLGTYPAKTPAILELSSFQLHYLAEEMFAPEIAIITNLAPNHLDWHQTLENYYADKKELIRRQTSSNFAILNSQDPILREWADSATSTVITTELADSEKDNTAFIRGDEFIIRHQTHETILSNLSDLNLPGKHNIANALQALTAAYIFFQDNQLPFSASTLNAGLSSFHGLAHRQEVVARNQGITYINDSIATTPESTIAALNSYPGEDIVIIAGGYDKEISLTQMAEEIAHKALAAVLIGNTAPKIALAINRINPDYNLTVITDNDFYQAVNIASQQLKTGIVLLSPGCASYDMFKNFQERGDKFKKITKKIL